ncbi:LysM peptidoglycan-binding domain-containing protein [Desulfobacula sp.]
MDTKDTPESKTSMTNINTDEKKTRKTHKAGKKFEPSHLKKNEFALILFGALSLTIIIFFLFFKSSDNRTEIPKINASSSAIADLEKRIETLEKTLEIRENTAGPTGGKDAGTMAEIKPLKERVASLETAFSAKFDSLIKRMGAIEKSISRQQKISVAAKTTKPVAPVKKKKKTGLFHTIQKGETLYSISKKYNTTVATIQRLNKLTVDSKIYPGAIILVR